MAGLTPNSPNIGRVAAGVANALNVVVNPEYLYWRIEWRKLRDVLAGQREIKRHSSRYLPPMSKMDKDDYSNYLERAVFYNMTAQTLNGMIGQVFRRDPVVKNIPKKFKNDIRLKFAKDGAGHISFLKTLISEQISMGRFGVLVDAPATPTTKPTSYVTGYAAENILDWSVAEVNGTYQLTRVLLREFEREQMPGPSQLNPWIGSRNPSSPGGRQTASNLVRPVNAYIEAYTYKTIYRELVLERQDDGSYVYRQYVYENDPNAVARESYTPVIRGQALNFIPFKFFGATGNTPDVEKSPLLDIADLNISHYRTYAELEWGRMYTALPVYYAPGRDDEGAAEYHIGPSRVWEVPPDQQPGILEYKGEGLKALERALDMKEHEIAAIGGRLLAGMKAKGGESPDQTAAKEANEQALLLNVVQAAEAGMVEVMRWWLMWRDVPLKESEEVVYRINRIFGTSGVDARTLRAITLLHDEGKVPIEVLYNALLNAEFLEAEIDLDDFKDMLKNPDNFPNNPDVTARQHGFISRQQELDQVNMAREADMQQQEIDLQERQVEMEEKAPPPVASQPSAPAPSGANPARAAGPVPARPAPKKSKSTKPTGGGV